MKALICIIALLYLVSPLDLAPGIPVDDIVVTIGSAAYALTPKD